MATNNNAAISFERVQRFLQNIVKTDVHAKRILSLTGATLGVIASGSLAVHAIGRGLAQATGKVTKHAIKQTDRMVGNAGIDVWDFFRLWVPFVIGGSKEILVAMDWTDFDNDGHTVIALHRITGHGRSTPLLWKTVEKTTLKGNRNKYEDELLERLYETMPTGVKVTVLADRGFFDHLLLEAMGRYWGFGYVFRMRGNILVTSEKGECRKAAVWVGSCGRTRVLRNAAVTAENYVAPTVVCLQAKDMKEPWCIVASDSEASGSGLVNYYAKRWGIESSFRDLKDLRFGLGMDTASTRSTARRDRLMLLNAIASALLTLLGSAGEALGYDRLLKANTVKRRTHSLFRQGLMHYQLIPMMPEERLFPLVNKFVEMISEQSVFSDLFGIL